jgi:hypothetical protein
MQRRKLIMTGVAILVFGVAFAAQRTAGDSDRGQDAAPLVTKWRPGSDIPMSAFEIGEDGAGRPR